MKQELKFNLPCGDDITAERDIGSGLWELNSACELFTITIEPGDVNIKAIKDMLDKLLENTPKRIRKQLAASYKRAEQVDEVKIPASLLGYP